MTLTIEHQAALDFVLTLRRQWAAAVYPRLRAQFDATGVPNSDPATCMQKVHALPGYPFFAWAERGSQQMLWRAVTASVGAAADPSSVGGASRVVLDPGLALPNWYTGHDIHLQPGGIWADAISARVYESGARLVMLGENDDYAFHRLFAESAIPKRDFARIVDLGCGFGKSTWPIKQAYSAADVIGIDLAAPCLSLAKARADERQLTITFVQADATDTGIEGESVDLVISTMLVHELPLDRINALFVESARLLAPGGILRFLDFQFTGDGFRDLAMIEHGVRNNEPFLPPMLAADLVAMASAAGLDNVRWRPFDERGAGLNDSDERLPRAEWHFPWAVLEADKPR